jgi:hypothetical protein
MKKTIAVCVLAAGLAGCQTQYGEMNPITGGVAAEQVTTDVYRIRAKGNGYTSASRVQDFVLLKAAETTLGAGATHFVLAGSSNTSTVGVVQTPGSFNMATYGNVTYGSYSPGFSDTFVKPGQDAYIRIIKASRGQQVPGAFDAAEIMQVIGPRLKGQ